jgi:YidC/Oxa1 family membrane protein insertase
MVSYLQDVEDSGGFLSMGYLSDPAESICHAEGEVERSNADDASENPRFQGPVRWGGVNSRYFMLASIPQDEPMKTCNFDLRQGEFLRTALVGESFRLEPGQSRSWGFIHYVGPKNVDVMESFGVEMEDSVDFGIFAFLCKPIHWLLLQLYGLVGNWGIAIILLTVILRMLTFPINHKSYKNMEGMRRVNEPLQAIKKKYEGSKDPQAQMQMQQEMMELYKKEGVNPLGCLPTFLQMPIFFALYRTIYGSVELYQADFFAWYTDLSSPDPYFVLPIMVGAVMFGQQFFMPSTGMENPQMKIMMWAMPLMFFVFSLMMPSGLALYMFVSISLGIAQQAYIRKSVRGKKDEPTILPAS